MNTRKVRAGQPAPDIDWPEPEMPEEVEVEDYGLTEAQYTALAVGIASLVMIVLLILQVIL